MGSSMYGDGDSLSVTAAGEEPGSGSREWVLQTSLEAVTEAFRKGPRSSLNGNHRLEQGELCPNNGRSRV